MSVVWWIGGLLVVLLLAALWRFLARIGQLLEGQRHLASQVQQQGAATSEIQRQLDVDRAEGQRQLAEQRQRWAETQATNLGQVQGQVQDVTSRMRQELHVLRTAVGQELEALRTTMGTQLGDHGKVIRTVQTQLGGLAEATRHFHQVADDVAGLHDLLRAPKPRGALGELFLEELLQQVLPREAFEIQHRLPGPDGGHSVAVDAAIRLADRWVPIDSKFPLESFERLLRAEDDAAEAQCRKAFADVVRGHIDVIAQKYIRPEAGTYDFALMYLPAEHLYYEAIVRDAGMESRSILAHAQAKKVIPVSPQTLYGYLLTIAYGLRGLHVEKRAEQILKAVQVFEKKFERFGESFQKVGRYVDLAYRTHAEAERRMVRLQEQVQRMHGTAQDEIDAGEAAVEAVEDSAA